MQGAESLGAGLVLAIVTQIAKTNGGSVVLDSVLLTKFSPDFSR